MPVRISDTPLDPQTMAITKDQFEDGRENFQAHYSKNGEGELLGQDFAVSWDELSLKVEAFCETAVVDPLDVAMRFVHCFDTTTSSLYLRLQICTMNSTDMTSYERPVYELNTTDSVWYRLDETGISSTTNEQLHCEIYTHSLIYKPNPEGLVSEVLYEQPTKFVNCLTFPWQAELLAMYEENGSPEDAKIHFGSTSYTSNEGNAAVVWPHGMVLYLEDSEGPMLTNDSSLVIFHYKGADMATVCPPQCGSYIMAPTAHF